MAQTKGSFAGGETDADTLDLADSAALRRVERFAGDLERLDDALDGGGGATSRPAAMLSAEGLSMYFSIRRSLFQCMCRKSKDAASAYPNRIINEQCHRRKLD